MTRSRWIAAAVLAVALVVALGLFQPWRLVTRSSIDEAIPMASTTEPMSDNMTEPMTEPMTDPAASPRTLATGRFVDGEHATSGTARILELADGSRYLRLEGFSTSDGPDVHVWLTDQPAGGTDWGRYDDGRHVTLGILKATDGNQNYPIPASTDLEDLTSAVIWCDRFNVAFGSAALTIA